MIPPIPRSQYKFFYPTLIVVGFATTVVILMMPIGPILKAILLAVGLAVVFFLNPISTALVSNSVSAIKRMFSAKQDEKSTE